jgi:hypothetical protein
MRTSTDGAVFAGLQARFSRALLERADAPAGLKRSDRFNIHRDNVFAGLVRVLRAHFPVVLRLVGEDFFQGAAREFIVTHPPASPVLLEFGAAFPEFLERFEPAEAVPYLGGIARLEWLRHTAYHAADLDPLTAEALARVPPENAAGLTFQFHPSAGLIASPYPIVGIWETNAFDEQVRSVAGVAGEAALIVRPEFEARVLRLDPGEYVFAAALARGSTLAAAAAQAQAQAGFALAPALARLIRAGAFAGFSRTGSKRRDFSNA